MKPTTILGVKRSDYQGIANLGNRAIASLTGNANFAAPNPTLVALQADVTALETAIATWGPVHNRGSHADLVALRAAAITVYNDLLAEAAYVQNTAQLAAGNDYALMAALIGTSGFAIKNAPQPQGLLGAPENLHRVFKNSVSLYTPLLDWKKPIGLTSPNNVKSYQILRHTDNNILLATVIATSTKTTFLDVTAGPGAESAVLQTSTPV